MKILLVSPRFPYPTRTGDTLTVYHMIKHFSQRHTVDLVSCVEEEPSPEYYAAVAEYCGLVLTVRVPNPVRILNGIAAVLKRQPLQPTLFSSPGMRRTIADLVRDREYDVLYAHTVRVAHCLLGLSTHTTALSVLAMQISMKLNYQRMARYERNFLYRMAFKYEASRLEFYERDLVEKFDRLLVISQVDKEAISRDPSDRFFECPHGVTLDELPKPAEGRKSNTIIFSGNMNYRPNVDAVIYFYRGIFPMVRRAIPTAKLLVVGANPDICIRKLSDDPGVHITGEVPSVYSWLRKAAVGIDPLRAGAGLQNKVLEGMACGLPMVVTPLANEGINATPGVHLFATDDPAEFSRCIVNLMQNAELRASMGEAARRFIEDQWSWEVHFNRLEAMFVDELNARRFD